MNHRSSLACAAALAALTSASDAAFHVMQIEQIIGGVNGDTSRQAIQLRMRSANQTVIGNGRLRAWDANGANPIVIVDPTTSVTNGAVGSNVLLASVGFNAVMASVPGYASDFTLTSLIPVAYLGGGKITWEDNSGATIYCSVAFGAYVGTNTGSTQNDADGNFGPPTSAPPTNARQGIRFTGAATALSTTNAADYAVTADPTTVRNNFGTTFTVVPEPGTTALVATAALGAFAFLRRRFR